MAGYFSDTIADDVLVAAADTGETVTYTHRDGTVDTITDAIPGEISRREIATSEGRFTAQDRAWNLPASQLSADPAEGEKLTAHGVDWYVHDTSSIAERTSWRLLCKRSR